MPGRNESSIVPVLFPMAAIIIPYGINLSYNLILLKFHANKFTKI